MDATLNQTLPPHSSRISFVLVRPSHPGNIGAAARAIKTMGFTDLRVVAPVDPEYRTHPDAVAFSTSSVDVLTDSRDYPTLEEALTDVALPFAMTGYSRRFGPALETMRESADRASLWAEENKGPGIAFVFGCERSGLTNEEVDGHSGQSLKPEPQSCSGGTDRSLRDAHGAFAKGARRRTLRLAAAI